MAMEAIGHAPMIAVSAAIPTTPATAGAGERMSAAGDIHAGPGASLAGQESFSGAVERATLMNSVPGGSAMGPAMNGVLGALEHVNAQARGVGEYAAQVTSSGRDMTPAEVISLTMRCQEFMFHCQLSSNIANRTSDGLQQIFRQQS